jgi:hypothetical protein
MPVDWLVAFIRHPFSGKHRQAFLARREQARVLTRTRKELAGLRQVRCRDEQRRRRAMQDLEFLGRIEQDLLQEGTAEADPLRRLAIARRINSLRQRTEGVRRRVEVYTKRLTVFNSHIASLELFLELVSEPLPDRSEVEGIAIQAGMLLEHLDLQAVSMPQAVREPEAPDPEEEAILREMQGEDATLVILPEEMPPEPQAPESRQTEPQHQEPHPREALLEE